MRQLAKAWLTELRKSRPEPSDAQSWLWRSIVGLLMTRETQDVEHCQRYVLERPLESISPDAEAGERRYVQVLRSSCAEICLMAA